MGLVQRLASLLKLDWILWCSYRLTPMAQWWVSVSLDLRGRLPEHRHRRVSETQRRPMNTAQKPLPSGISIVSTEPRHAVSLCQAVGEVARERRWLAAVEAFTEGETQLFVQLNQAAGVPQFVALYGPKVVGWCDIVRLYPYPGYEHNGRLGMGVLAPWRGQGVGRQLLDQALNAALGAGFRRVELEVYASNMAAVSLYQSRGFAVEGVKRAMRVLDGRVDDVVLMARPTTDGPPEVLSNTRVVGESCSWKVTL